MRKQPQALRLPEDLKVRLQALSAQSGVSVSELIRACITRALPYVESILPRN
jgi:predicted DNA-binding protein